MKLKDVQKEEVKDVVVTARVTKKDFKWMKDNNISSSLIFEKAIEELKNSRSKKIIKAKKIAKQRRRKKK